MTTNKMPNRLIQEKSPYLLQHAYNPINWYAWSDEAFAKAKEEDKPIFLSIGYSTCHWCHVMAHESFEDTEVAKIMNDNFIAIKVDREERPDVDSVYMTVCQALTNHGGWPLTIIMTPDQKPFFAGTYFPKQPKYNMPGIIDILNSIITHWKDNKDKLISSSESILSELSKYYVGESNDIKLNSKILENGYNQLVNVFDKKNGGFGSAPKFPTPHKLMFLLRYYKSNNDIKALEMVENTLDCMYKGGLFDHIGFGFSRYSTDNKWLVPHFEKMLYDNALLIIAYLEGYEVTKNELYKNVAIKALEYIFRELTNENGGFYCAEDADSEGEEGKYYVFNPAEILEVLGNEEDGTYFNDYFDITNEGNFEGKSILNLINNSEYNKDNDRIRDLSEKVLEYRFKRMKLHKDDKILTSWNGLMIAALGKAYKVVEDERYFEYAKKAVNFIFDNLIDENKRLLARFRDEESRHKAYLDDYAFLCFGLIELYESSFDITFLKKAIELNKDMINFFWDKEKNGFFLYGEDSEQLIAKPKELFDGAMPSGNSVAAYNLIKLSRITGDTYLEEMAEKQLNFISGALFSEEINHSFFLIAASFALNNSKELVCVIKDKSDEEKIKDLLSEKQTFNLTVIIKNDDNKKEVEELIPFIKDYDFVNDKSTYYLCEGKSCLAPTNDIEELRKLL
ncbi:thioredoxin domain-containing protein [Clostridium gelidum]|uniref:Thioredoxin domain-containing protein n=1 Tax=Clostridium gelidum TaxID=704125 RepID=A0ABM7T597_9CLOT|nr:thioredoxin domain-containing protein [Clostridium gelidum]BCZ47147.1 thioredoxin domain-containing protein [Clostridium gelidum]